MSSRFFINTACEFFPCHAGIDSADFSCLFCYCPLYALGKSCGGDFIYLENGIKDCSNCAVPHKKENCDDIIARFPEIKALFKSDE